MTAAWLPQLAPEQWYGVMNLIHEHKEERVLRPRSAANDCLLRFFGEEPPEPSQPAGPGRIPYQLVGTRQD